jgi:peptidoglycan hydrolase CwlO-like protein
MRARAQEQLSSKKSLIDKLYQDIAEHKHDLLLLQKQTDDVHKQQESLNEYLKVRGLPTQPLSRPDTLGRRRTEK